MTALDTDTDDNIIMISYHSIEAVIILLFIVEIITYKYAFKEMYFHNKFNVVNLILTITIILFLVLDIFITNKHISILLRIRGVMRLFHVPVILENIKSHIRQQRGLNIMDSPYLEVDKPNSEQVIEILLRMSE